MGDEKKLVPRIRFPEFTDDWEQRKLGELGSFKNGMNFSKDAMDKGYPFVNLQNIFGRNVIDIDNLGLAEASDNQLKEYNLQEGDVLFVRSSVKLEGVGEAAIVPKNLENTTYSGFVIRFRDETDMDINFKRFIFGTKPIRDQIMAKATNSANKNISQDVLNNLELYLPLKTEQQKIGEYFSNIDNLITLHQRKCDTYKKMKKGMMQKLFNQEVRFKKDDGSDYADWEEKEMWQITTWDKKFNEVDRDKQPAVIKYPYVLADVFKNIEDNTGTVKLLSTGTYVGYTTEEKAGTNLCEGEVVAIPGGGEPNIKYHNGKFVTSDNRIAQASNLDILDMRFLASYMELHINELKSYYRGASIKHPSMRDVLDMIVNLPEKEEQTKIANCLSEYDALISASEQKLEAYKKLKKAMLQKMLV